MKQWMFSGLFSLISPRVCYRWMTQLRLPLLIINGLLFIYGLMAGLYLAPPDYQQGEGYRIIFIHVPAAIWSLGVYLIMAAAAFVYLVWRIKLADMIAKHSAPIGAVFTGLALITGSLWGKPMWNTWWIWDARLTSELILLFIYAGIISLRLALPEPELAARVSAILTLMGVVNIPIIHYSVDWWQTLHQGATLLQFSHPLIATTMLYPLLVMILAFFIYYLVVLMLGVQKEILIREQKTTWVQATLFATLSPVVSAPLVSAPCSSKLSKVGDMNATSTH